MQPIGSWTTERIDTLIRLARVPSLGYSEIADALSAAFCAKITKNAVVGKLDRLRAAGVDVPRRPNPAVKQGGPARTAVWPPGRPRSGPVTTLPPLASLSDP